MVKGDKQPRHSWTCSSLSQVTLYLKVFAVVTESLGVGFLMVVLVVAVVVVVATEDIVQLGI